MRTPTPRIFKIENADFIRHQCGEDQRGEGITPLATMGLDASGRVDRLADINLLAVKGKKVDRSAEWVIVPAVHFCILGRRKTARKRSLH